MSNDRELKKAWDNGLELLNYFSLKMEEAAAIAPDEACGNPLDLYDEANELDEVVGGLIATHYPKQKRQYGKMFNALCELGAAETDVPTKAEIGRVSDLITRLVDNVAELKAGYKAPRLD